MPRPQFTLRALLVAMLVVGAFLGGMAVRRKLDMPVRRQSGQRHGGGATTWVEEIVLPDGSEWHRSVIEWDKTKAVVEMPRRLEASPGEVGSEGQP